MTTNKPKIKSAISLKLDRQSDERQDRLNKWLDAQSNYTNSLFSLIDHMIDRFGYEDITSHEVNKRLFLERLHYEKNASSPGASIGTTNTPVEIPVGNSLGNSLSVSTTEEKNIAASKDVNESVVPSENDAKEEGAIKSKLSRNVDIDSFFK